ncbi:MAG TPA: substrate-binding domain-containing protein [Terriglobales bacterium]|nr:substrate-binding domain-containing protein [Terriglobales bacterium]
MNLRPSVLGIAVLWCCLLALGCQSRDSRTVAVIPETTGNVMWEAAHAGAEAAAGETGLRVYWNAPTREDDVERQITLVEKVIEDKDAGLVLAPTQYLALVGPVREALSAHIPTVVIRSSLPIPSGQGLSYILNNENEMGRIAAMRIGKILHGRGEVAILGLDPDITGVIIRSRAFESALAANFPPIAIVERPISSSNAAEFQQVAQETISSHPGLGAILALNVAAAERSWAALSASGKTSAIRLVACGQEMDLMARIRSGSLDSVIVENTYEMGSRAVRLIAARRRGQAVPDRIELPPVLVDQTNIDRPEIQQMLSMDWRPH